MTSALADSGGLEVGVDVLLGRVVGGDHVVLASLKRREKRAEGGDELDARQGTGSSAHLKLEKNAVLTAGTTSRRGTRLSCVPSMLGSWEVKVFYPT